MDTFKTDYAPHMTPVNPPIRGFHILPAIPPWCKEVRVPVELIKRDGNRVLLRDLEMAKHGVGYLIDDDIGSFRETSQ